MDSKVLTSKQYFKFLSLIYGVMLLAQVGTGAVLLFLRSTQGEVMHNESQLAPIFQLLVPITAIIMPASGLFLTKSSLKKIPTNEPLSNKLSKYQSCLLLKYAFFEGPTILAFVAYFLTGDRLILGIAGGLVLIFLTQIPTKSRALGELSLTPLEESSLNNPEAEVAEMLIKD